MKLKPLSELLAMTKQGIDEALAPMRAKHIKAKADVKIAELEERGVHLEREVQELCTSKDIDFDKVVDKMDEAELNERRIKQLRGIVDELFPATAA